MEHPDWSAFLAAIIADPDDDTVRLVAADFLEENGEPDRAAFIRIQCELARLEAAGLGKSLEVDELRKKERAYLGPLSTFHLLWAAEACPELVRVTPPARGSSPLAHIQVEGAERLIWRRGFVELVRCPAAEWLNKGVAVRKQQPVRDVVLAGCDTLRREEWYEQIASLHGLRKVYLHDCERNLIYWLQGWMLRSTQVLWPSG